MAPPRPRPEPRPSSRRLDVSPAAQRCREAQHGQRAVTSRAARACLEFSRHLLVHEADGNRAESTTAVQSRPPAGSRVASSRLRALSGAFERIGSVTFPCDTLPSGDRLVRSPGRRGWQPAPLIVSLQPSWRCSCSPRVAELRVSSIDVPSPVAKRGHLSSFQSQVWPRCSTSASTLGPAARMLRPRLHRALVARSVTSRVPCTSAMPSRGWSHCERANQLGMMASNFRP